MRLHSLTVTAFGPFAGTERVDFDALTASGLFLLRGATGAGKTSVLDAVCFALYGAVPGSRQGTRLRSDHADPQLMTEVVLDVTLGGRRLEITRRPEQPRPKKRGEGFTTERAQTLLREWTAGDPPGWRAASKSHQEVGEEIGRLLGMSRDQFCQVVLLPQGDFARFLRADATERAELLGRLFDTRRFGRVEDWLTERRRAGEEGLRSAQDGLRQLVARLEQAAGADAEPAEAWIPADDAAGLARSAPAWAAILRCGAEEQRAVAAAALDRAEQQHRLRAEQEAAARELTRRQESHTQALRRAGELAKADTEREALRQRLAAARAADVVAAALRLERTADAAYRTAAERERRARAGLGGEAADAVAQLVEAEQRARADLVRLEAAREDERRQAGAAAELHRLEAERRAAEELAEEAERWLARLPEQRAGLDLLLAGAREGAARAEQLAAREQEARQRLAAARQRDALRDRARRAAQLAADAGTAAADARTGWLDLRERRLDGMAAELAERLRDGDPCPVCGSAGHPAPARPSGGRVTREDEQVAEAAFRHAETAELRAAEALRSVREEAAGAAAVAGEEPVAALAAGLAELAAGLADALAVAEGLVGAEQALAALDRQCTEQEDQQRQATGRVAVLTARLEALTAELGQLAARVAAARGDAPSVAVRAAGLTDRAERLAAAAGAAREAEEAAARLKDAQAEVSAAAVAAGFAGAEEASAALLDAEERAAVEARLTRWDREHAAVRALLDDPDLAAAAALPPADPAAARVALEAATARLRTAAAADDAARRRCAELRRLGGELAERAAGLAPALAEQARISRLSFLASGTGGGNRLRMRLESYVLAARLEQVAAAASGRLVRMSGGRYTLVHSADRAAGTKRSGLGLRVVDAWTGTERDTATLSGGESFFASLALALGLADVVTDEAGGMPLDTLFIDEGFGTLDEQALEEVLDVLDGLRERDRAVGIVSHVADLRQRVPAQLLVRKGRTGSTLHLTGPDAA
ncbi:AAA family ATPase [Streptomyces sp. NPDC092296]|uniref:AAA family ATPase n=1 Tax=Streptomyces sp. NPDC092296 TaxID=3366012 RepID=UPI0038216722